VLDMEALNFLHNQQKMLEYAKKRGENNRFYPVRKLGRGERVGHNGFIGNVQYTGRSISLVGILGGIIFILLMIACATCIKHRKRYPLESRHQDRLARQMIADHIRQVTHGRASAAGLLPLHYRPDKPPDYDTVVKEEEGELPSYVEAVGEGGRMEDRDVCMVELQANGVDMRGGDLTVIVEEDDDVDDKHQEEGQVHEAQKLEELTESSETSV